MNSNELASKLNGREYRSETTVEIEQLARDNNLVIVFGASDNLVEFRGAIHDEFDAPGIIPIGNSGIVTSDENAEFPHFNPAIDRASKIHACWCEPGEPDWTYRTYIPHSTFDIFEDDEVYCRGIVFSLDDVK